MKIKTITLNNFAKYDQVTVSFDDNVTYLIGKNGSGKSTLGITAIWFMFQGIAEKASNGNNPLIGERFRFIGPKAASAKGEMILIDEKTGAEISVFRKLTKSGTELFFQAPEGYTLDQNWLNDLFNIFLIAPKKFTELSPKDQAKALGIDTKKFDDDIANLKQEYTGINAVYKSFGDLVEPEKVEKVDIAELQQKKEAVRVALNEQYTANKKANENTRKEWEAAKKAIDNEVTQFNWVQLRNRENIDKAIVAMEGLESVGYDDVKYGSGVQQWIDSLPRALPKKVAAELFPAEPTYLQELPDDSELKAIDQQIIEASETNRKALLYEQHIEKKQQKDAKAQELADNKKKQADKEQERIEYIKAFKFPFSNLSVDDEGQLLLAGKPIKDPYFSTGELLKIIPILLSTSNPELKYVFVQGFNDLDEDNWKQVEEYLLGKGFQLVIEMVGKEKLTDKNCILLKDNIVIETYEQEKTPELI